jgi:anti-sigma regulatory factor (Ser/Thr protein kinase)
MPDIVAVEAEKPSSRPEFCEEQEMEQKLRLDLTGKLSPKLVLQVHDAVEKAMTGNGLSRDTCFAAMVVAEELCTNIMEYSNAKWLELNMDSSGDEARVRVRDDGEAFNPCEVIVNQARDFDLGQLQGRGMGLYLVRQLTRDFRCSRDSEGCNVFEFEIGYSGEKKKGKF